MTRNLATLAIASAAGYGASLLSAPMPWLLGPLLLIGGLSFAGLDVALPHAWRNWMIAVISVSLGAAFVPEVFANLADWAASLMAVAAITIAMMCLSALIARLWFRLDWPTSVVCSAPGAMSQVLAIGESVRADMGPVLVVHMTRVMLVVLTVPTSILILTGHLGEALPETVRADGAPVWAWGVLAACLLGYPLAARLRLPTASLMGPMILSGLVHYFGVIAVAPPSWTLAVAQVVLGASVGADIGRIPRPLFFRYLALALVITVLASGLALCLAFLMAWVTGLDLPMLILSYMPGGTPEMVIATILVGSDPAFVSVHHLLRLMLIMALAPFIIRWSTR